MVFTFKMYCLVALSHQKTSFVRTRFFVSDPQDRYIIRAKPCISSKTAKPVLHLITPQGVYFPLHFHEFVFSAAQADLFGVCKAGLPLGIGVGVGEMVAVVAEAGDLQVLREHTAGEGRRLEAGIDARLVERERVKRAEHSDVR